MHIPDQMLQGAVCPVTAVIGLVGVTLAAVAAARSENKPGVSRFAAVSAFIFAAQMLNFPVLEGISGHLLGGVLAVALLGAPFAVLALTLVLVVQAVVFNDGGLLALGANVTNMALLGAAFGALLQKLAHRNNFSLLSRGVLYGIAGWLSVMAGVLALCVEMAASSTAAFTALAPAMLGVHAWIGVGEAVITTAVYLVWASSRENTAVFHREPVTILVTALVAAVFLGPLASSLPDGLEFVAASLGLLPVDSAISFAPLSGYHFPVAIPAAMATGLAGLVGVILTFSTAWLVGKRIQDSAHKACH